MTLQVFATGFVGGVMAWFTVFGVMSLIDQVRK